jgi:hypothetical protein
MKAKAAEAFGKENFPREVVHLEVQHQASI